MLTTANKGPVANGGPSLLVEKSWPEERAEIAIWLSGFLGPYKKWVDKILDNDDHEAEPRGGTTPG